MRGTAGTEFKCGAPRGQQSGHLFEEATT
jgi:hypothetical protein